MSRPRDPNKYRPYENAAQHFRTMLAERHLSQLQAADLLNTDISMIRRHCSGTRPIPRMVFMALESINVPMHSQETGSPNGEGSLLLDPMRYLPEKGATQALPDPRVVGLGTVADRPASEIFTEEQVAEIKDCIKSLKECGETGVYFEIDGPTSALLARYIRAVENSNGL